VVRPGAGPQTPACTHRGRSDPRRRRPRARPRSRERARPRGTLRAPVPVISTGFAVPEFAFLAAGVSIAGLTGAAWLVQHFTRCVDRLPHLRDARRRRAPHRNRQHQRLSASAERGDADSVCEVHQRGHHRRCGGRPVTADDASDSGATTCTGLSAVAASCCTTSPTDRAAADRAAAGVVQRSRRARPSPRHRS
jgi:hypothetical protein